MDPVVGIDLGTTNSVVALVEGGKVRVLPDREGRVLQPSVVSFHPSGKILAGQAAKKRRVIDPHNTIFSIKRLIGRDVESEEVVHARERFPFALNEANSKETPKGTFNGTILTHLSVSHTRSVLSPPTVISPDPSGRNVAARTPPGCATGRFSTGLAAPSQIRTLPSRSRVTTRRPSDVNAADATWAA